MGILSVDTAVNNQAGKLVASYGPRKVEEDNSVIPATAEDYAFYGVYRHHPDTGEAEWVADVVDTLSAVAVAGLVAKLEEVGPGTAG